METQRERLERQEREAVARREANRHPHGMSFEEWLEAVDGACWALAGVGLSDLVDVPTREWWEGGVSVVAAARRAIRRSGAGE